MKMFGPCYIVRRGEATDLRNLAPGAFAAIFLNAAALSAAAAQSLPVMVGQDYESAVAALKAGSIAGKEEPAGAGRKIFWTSGSQSVTLEFSPWPSDPNAPASAWASGSTAARTLTLTRIVDTAPSSEARRAWVNSLAREGKGWAYLAPEAEAARTAADRAKYPVAASLTWQKPPAALLFQAARPAGTPPGSEPTQLDILLENPHGPRRF
jgi:hypothetical protein